MRLALIGNLSTNTTTKTMRYLQLIIAVGMAILPGPKAHGWAPPLVWAAILQKHEANPGETNVLFTFQLTNAAVAEDVIITAVRPSCGCTTAKMPPLPWRLGPGASGQIEATVDIRGKHGLVNKIVSVESSAGTNLLTLVINIAEDRARNMDLALADRQAVFRGQCATCHVQPSVGKTGLALYRYACGICHESEHRASMVPNLNALNKPTGREYWDGWVRNGKAGSLMPAFSQAAGGPLAENQIATLVDYLADHFPGTMAPVRPAP